MCENVLYGGIQPTRPLFLYLQESAQLTMRRLVTNPRSNFREHLFHTLGCIRARRRADSPHVPSKFRYTGPYGSGGGFSLRTSPRSSHAGPGVFRYFLSPRPCPYSESEEREGAPPPPAPSAVAAPSIAQARGERIPQRGVFLQLLGRCLRVASDFREFGLRGSFREHVF